MTPAKVTAASQPIAEQSIKSAANRMKNGRTHGRSPFVIDINPIAISNGLRSG
jgi:hypothetical protein